MPRRAGATAIVLGIATLAATQGLAWTDPADPPQAPASALTAAVEVEERLRQLEATNRRLAEALEATNRRHAEELARLSRQIEELAARPAAPPDPIATTDGAPLVSGGEAAEGRGPTDPTAPGRSASDRSSQVVDPGSPVPRYRISTITSPVRAPLKAGFGPGFELLSDDEELQLQIHLESQFESRIWQQPNQEPTNSGFFAPRNRIFFNGRVTKPVEYMFSINRGFGTLEILDAYINLHPDDRLQVRFGRFMTPLFYEQYAIQNMWLATPERSLFTANLGLNRNLGLMAWGYLFNKRLDYAFGAFNGPRNSFVNLNDNIDFIGYLNARPFQDSEPLWYLRYLNLGTSVAFGRQGQAPLPRTYRVATNASNAGDAGIAAAPFLGLNADVIERGDRLLGSAFASYFFRSFTLLSELQYGFINYANEGSPDSVQVPVSGFHVTASYFLTGEHLERRTMVEPRRPFRPTWKDGGPRGPGAWELAARYSQLHFGEQIFAGGLADPNLWSNDARTFEVGLNWYWNPNVKIYMFWQQGAFGEPVLYAPGPAQQLTTDLFWLRFQFFY